MKKVIALMLGLVAGTASFAQTTSPAPVANVILTSASEKLKLFVAPEAATATVNLMDAEGHVLYTHKVDLQKGFRQDFNIAGLEPGTYQIAVRTGSQAVIRTFVIDDVPAQKQIILQA